jgi:hypothetical protein
MPKDVFQDLKKAWVCNQQLRISRVAGEPAESGVASSMEAGTRPPKKTKPKKKEAKTQK